MSGTDSRKDLDSYFDAPVAKKARRFSSDAAAKEMDEIFQNSKADRQDMKSRRDKIKRQQKSAVNFYDRGSDLQLLLPCLARCVSDICTCAMHTSGPLRETAGLCILLLSWSSP